MKPQSLEDTSRWGIFKISLPMMISAISSHMMLFLDQLVLANYSVTAMTGASAASLWSAIIQCIALSTTMIAGVYAGHYNGAKKYSKAGSPVWQMIYFSFGLFAISIPAGLFFGEYCIPKALQNDGIPYFRLLMCFSPLTGVIYSLSSFFVSIGRGLIVTISVTVANVFNIFAIIVLVFGKFGMTGFEGSIGAALGTILAWCVNIGILVFFFFRRDVRRKYGIMIFKFKLRLMKKCLKMGLPGGIGHTLEMASWSIVYYLLASIGPEIAMIQTMAFSVNIFLSFIASGLEKGMMAMTSNFLGAQRTDRIKVIFKNGLFIHFIFAGLLFSIFYIFPEVITSQFIKFAMPQEVMDKAFFILKLVWIFFLFDGSLWVIAGVIEAGGDIRYVTLSIASCLWAFVAIPAIVFSYYDNLSIEKIWYCLIGAVLVITSLLYMRYRSNKWMRIRV